MSSLMEVFHCSCG